MIGHYSISDKELLVLDIINLLVEFLPKEAYLTNIVEKKGNIMFRVNYKGAVIDGKIRKNVDSSVSSQIAKDTAYLCMADLMQQLGDSIEQKKYLSLWVGKDFEEG